MEISLTNREADVMRVLWDCGPSVVSEVRERLSDRSEERRVGKECLE